MPTTRSLLLLLLLLLPACDERHGDRGETPYAAQMALSRPAYVRPAAGAKSATTSPTVAETFADPQYTVAQSVAGAEVYKATCSKCHASSQWQGSLFAANWRDRRLSDFHDLVATTMPQDSPGSLTSQQYVDVTAYVLQLAGFPAGVVPLRGDSAMLRHARITIKTPPPTDTSSRK